MWDVPKFSWEWVCSVSECSMTPNCCSPEGPGRMQGKSPSPWALSRGQGNVGIRYRADKESVSELGDLKPRVTFVTVCLAAGDKIPERRFKRNLNSMYSINSNLISCAPCSTDQLLEDPLSLQLCYSELT